MAKHTAEKPEQYTEETLRQVQAMGALGYGVEKALNIVDVEDEAKFRRDFSDPNSQVGRAYQKGVDRAQFQIDQKLFELAKMGDLKALAKLEERQYDEKRKQQGDSDGART